METMKDIFSRTEMLLGIEALDKLRDSKVAIFGIGGVGSYATEALIRGGVGSIALFDKDIVSFSNINRQLIATLDTVGRYKVDVMAERIRSINPKARIETFPVFYGEENAHEFNLSDYSYIIDAIDTVSSKVTLIEKAKAVGTPIISAMGAGNKLDPTKFKVGDIYETSVCPLARVMRQRLRKKGIDSLKVVYSTEPAIAPKNNRKGPGEDREETKVPPGSVSFVPSVAGLIIAGEVIKDLTLV